ncbi:MAG: hypothetical protein LC637_10190 [Xanthomonadaceae bacterium]|nr:hypothetical protein [Xanthomonadaceae bacterium]
MWCPFCNHTDTRVVDSRLTSDGFQIRRLDQVAYVRFASVYRRFEDVQAFREEIERLEREQPEGIDARQISLLGQRDD